MSERETILVRQTVVSTLQMLGIDSGLISYNRAQKLYGKPFRDMAKRGIIKPVSVGEGKNGTKTYSIQSILEKMA